MKELISLLGFLAFSLSSANPPQFYNSNAMQRVCRLFFLITQGVRASLQATFQFYNSKEFLGFQMIKRDSVFFSPLSSSVPLDITACLNHLYTGFCHVVGLCYLLASPWAWAEASLVSRQGTNSLLVCILICKSFCSKFLISACYLVGTST